MHKSRARLPLIILGIAAGLLLAVRYTMPFRLDDVLHIEWALKHSFWQAWDPVAGQIVRSFRPTFAATIWLLTYTAGTESYLPWQLVLIFSMFGALYFAARTSELISESLTAFYAVPLVYPLAFLSTLNILFWYGDLTFSVELLFAAAAWFLGLRALLDGKPRLILPATLCGLLAVMSKEPAIVLVNAVWISAFLLRYKEVKTSWQRAGGLRLPLLMLFVVLAGSLWILIASPTKSNRFFLLSDPNISFFISDRLRYYGSVLLAPLPRLLLFFPQIALIFIGGSQVEGRRLWLGLIAGLIVTLLLLQWPLVVMAVSPISILLLMRIPHHRRAATLLLPFAMCVSIILAVLTVTVTLTKSQLTELAIAQSVISGWAWSKVFVLLLPVRGNLMRFPLRRRLSRVQQIGAFGVAVLLGIVVAFPAVSKREQLLRKVQAVRSNANNCIKYMAKELPAGSTIAVTGYSLYGMKNGDELTGQDDQVKLRNQYTFVGGYVRIYLQDLGRGDLRLTYLEDTRVAPLALDSLRATANAYLLLQIEPDLRWFATLRRPGDSLVARYNEGPFPSEIWKLRL